ncbi:hypothetical protein NLX83_29820 [Allokutzneria sp. A3M-2-11 16]|uniref:hypothetical protein n=1 Tax=Allokutzneria sp. A3M-2-11 16 TaxID=2962043 RepID=UPI0020B7F085|nr:hypothetical protein [Allokutzneria sp. A3M-2-11 16]MCP3803478.1 hypothetical protein [Allokutzneria sp. A3M-2-11 16]
MDMGADMNVVVFQVNGDDDDLLQGAAPAQAEDAVRQAWRQVQEERQVPASEITRVHCTWQPSGVDRVFLAGTFRGAEFTHVFDRPRGGDWSAALATAAQVFARAHLERGVQTAAKAEAEGEWLPILHTYDGPLKIYASFPVAGDRLHMGFAKVVISDTGRVGMSHLLRNRLAEMSADELEELAAEASGNLLDGLRFAVHADEKKGRLVTLERGEDNLCAASAVVMDDFHEEAAAQVGEDELVVGLISPDHICVAGANSGWAEEIKGWVLASPDTSGDLVPSVLLMDGSGTREILAERPTGRQPAG